MVSICVLSRIQDWYCEYIVYRSIYNVHGMAQQLDHLQKGVLVHTYTLQHSITCFRGFRVKR